MNSDIDNNANGNNRLYAILLPSRSWELKPQNLKKFISTKIIF